jgi:glutathione S-transferase
MLTVHHLGISQSERIVWLCEELAIPYRLVHYERDSVTRLAPAAYRALTPMGIAPVIEDGDLVLGESGAIIDYVITRYGDGRLRVAPGEPNHADYLFWFHFANGTMMPSVMTGLLMEMFGVADEHPMAAAMRSRGERAFRQVESRLGEARWFAGPAFTAADIIMLFPLTTMRAFVPRDLNAFPNIEAYLQRVGEQTRYRQALAKSDPGFEPLLA